MRMHLTRTTRAGGIEGDALGQAGAVVSLDLMHEHGMRHLQIKSVNRLDYLKLRSSF